MTLTATSTSNSKQPLAEKPLLKAGTSAQNDDHKAKNNCFCQRELTAAAAPKKLN